MKIQINIDKSMEFLESIEEIDLMNHYILIDLFSIILDDNSIEYNDKRFYDPIFIDIEKDKILENESLSDIQKEYLIKSLNLIEEVESKLNL